MHIILETERLLLREFTLLDGDFIVELLNSPGWIEFIGDRNVKTIDQAERYLENGPLKSYQENGFGLSLVVKKEDQTPIGMCGLLKRESLEHPDIGFALLPQFTGQGFAFEIATATLQYAKIQLKQLKIEAITDLHNQKSIRLLQKIGFTFVQNIKMENEVLMLFST
jgi:RimJ/RimL family protein N-acetyltransferase